jgi:hypothetical protein
MRHGHHLERVARRRPLHVCAAHGAGGGGCAREVLDDLRLAGLAIAVLGEPDAFRPDGHDRVARER